jgi:hypothetical protein
MKIKKNKRQHTPITSAKGRKRNTKVNNNYKNKHQTTYRASSAVIVAHLIATLYFFVASAESNVTLSSVASRCGNPKS